MSRPRITIVQASLQPPGGAQAVGTWAIEALKADYDVTTLTWTPFDPVRAARRPLPWHSGDRPPSPRREPLLVRPPGPARERLSLHWTAVSRKELDRVIDIVAAVRRQVRDVRLRLVGTRGPSGYSRRIRRRVAREGSWVQRDENLSRDELTRLIPRCRYGIHGMREEHFGIAPAEKVSAGCIVFVPGGGGQAEIVGGDHRLTYGSVEEAVHRVRAVIESRQLQGDLRAFLDGRRHLFPTERFVAGIRAIVADFLRGRAGQAPPSGDRAEGGAGNGVS